MSKYKLLFANRQTKDCERAVLPTILYASKSNYADGVKVVARAITIGWWAWGIGVMQTSVKGKDQRPY